MEATASGLIHPAATSLSLLQPSAQPMQSAALRTLLEAQIYSSYVSPKHGIRWLLLLQTSLKNLSPAFIFIIIFFKGSCFSGFQMQPEAWDLLSLCLHYGPE